MLTPSPRESLFLQRAVLVAIIAACHMNTHGDTQSSKCHGLGAQSKALGKLGGTLDAGWFRTADLTQMVILEPGGDQLTRLRP